MTLQDDMRESWESDQRDERRMKDLLFILKDFEKDPPARCRPYTRQYLRAARDGLERDCAQIVAAWD